MSKDRVWTAALVIIGDEILSGRTQDKNVVQLATWLNDHGIVLDEVRIVPDDHQKIGEAVNALRVKHDYLFTTGGIGPTHDDITIDAIAAALGVPVIVHPHALQILEDYYRDRPGGLTEPRLRMARTQPQAAARGDDHRMFDERQCRGGTSRCGIRAPLQSVPAYETHHPGRHPAFAADHAP